MKVEKKAPQYSIVLSMPTSCLQFSQQLAELWREAKVELPEEVLDQLRQVVKSYDTERCRIIQS